VSYTLSPTNEWTQLISIAINSRLVTWNVTSPYNYLSVSKPLTYLGTNQADPIFTVSMACKRNLVSASFRSELSSRSSAAGDHPTDRHGLGLNHGFLDDTVLLSFGVADYGSAYIVRLRYSWIPNSQSKANSVRFE